MRTYSYNHIFANGIIMILICALEVIIKMCLQRIEVWDVSKLRLDRHTSCIKSQLSNRRPYPSCPGVMCRIQITSCTGTWRDLDRHRSTLVFPMHFVLVRPAHMGQLPSRSPILLLQAEPLNFGVLSEWAPKKKKEFLIDMSSLSSLLSQALTYTPTQRNRRPRRPAGTFPLGTRLCVQSGTCAMPCATIQMSCTT